MTEALIIIFILYIAISNIVFMYMLNLYKEKYLRISSTIMNVESMILSLHNDVSLLNSYKDMKIVEGTIISTIGNPLANLHILSVSKSLDGIIEKDKTIMREYAKMYNPFYRYSIDFVRKNEVQITFKSIFNFDSFSTIIDRTYEKFTRSGFMTNRYDKSLGTHIIHIENKYIYASLDKLFAELNRQTFLYTIETLCKDEESTNRILDFVSDYYSEHDKCSSILFKLQLDPTELDKVYLNTIALYNSDIHPITLISSKLSEINNASIEQE